MKKEYITPETVIVRVAVENCILSYSVKEADDEKQRPVTDGDLPDGVEVGSKRDGGGIWGDDEW